MSRRKVAGLAGLARDTARGRQIVLSAGSIDGAFLAALRKVQPTAQPDAGSVVSAWGEGVKPTESDNPSSQMQKEGTR